MLSYATGKILLNDCTYLTWIIKPEQLRALLRAVLDNQASQVFEIIEDMAAKRGEFSAILANC